MLAHVDADSFFASVLARQTPSLQGKELLALGDDDYTERPFEQRRAALEEALASVTTPLHLTPATTDHALAQRMAAGFAGIEGLVVDPPQSNIVFVDLEGAARSQSAALLASLATTRTDGLLDDGVSSASACSTASRSGIMSIQVELRRQPTGPILSPSPRERPVVA